MTAYAVAMIESVKDPEKFAAYREIAGEALARHGGRVAYTQPEPVRLEGTIAAPKVLVLLEFPTGEAARAWHADPELADAHALRREALAISIFVVAQAA